MGETLHADRCLCGEAPLEPEKSVPVTGFSRELRLASDVERFWFSFELRGDVALPVHIVFSSSQRLAEVKAADLKAYRVNDVSSACEARLRWVEWWRKVHAAAPARAGRSPRPALAVPRRTGRLPLPSPSAS
jgi:hypothetical protein